MENDRLKEEIAGLRAEKESKSSKLKIEKHDSCKREAQSLQKQLKDVRAEKDSLRTEIQR